MSNFKTNRSPTSGPLRFITTGQLFGRDNEVRLLKEALAETSEEGKRHPGVCVSGYAGTGKSSLVRHSLRVKEEDSQYVFVEGRFDAMCSHRPYSAIVTALNQLCETLREDDVENLKDRFQEDEILTLTNFIPALKAKFVKHSQEEFGRDTNWGAQRLQDSVKVLLEAVTEKRPVVLFLDGLQWADEESLKLLASVFVESSIPRLLFVVALREDEVRNDILSSIVDNKALLAIRTTNLSQTSANDYLSHVLQRDSESTMNLAEVIHRKTYGNVYFMIQFLKCLQQGNMLFFSLLSHKWEWDLQKITSETTLTDNVADMVTGRLRLLPLETQTALQIASCIGHRFDATVLGQVLDHWSENPKLTESFPLKASQANDSVDIAHVLDSSCRDDLLEQTQVINTELCVYQFSHSRVQEAAYNSIGDSADQAEYHVKIGRLLWRIYNSSKEQDWMLLLAVDQLDRSMHLLDGEPEEVALARMNLEASDKVCSTWAFAAAAGYARASLRLLGENKWEKYYETTLTASTLSCRMEYCCGNFERVRCIAAEVLAFAQNIDEKFTVLLKEVQCLSSLQQHREASEKARSTLSELGRSFSVPAKPYIHHILIETIKVKRLMRGLSDSDILNYQICTDARAEKAIHMMSALCKSAWIAQDTDLFAFVSLRLMRISLICGRTMHFALAMSAYSILTLYLRDYERGNRYGILSVKISNLCKSNFARVDNNMLHHTFCHHLHSPYQQSLEPLLQGYRLGMSVSNVEAAHSSIVMYLACYFCSGLPLGSMVKDSKAFFDEMLPYNNLTLLTIMAVQRQFALNLTDTQRIPNGRIKGEAVDELKEKVNVCLDANSEMKEVPNMFFEMVLAYFLGEGKWATSRAKRYRRKMDEDFPILMSLTFPFYRSLIWIDEIRFGNRRYWWLLRRDLKLMRSWVKRGFVNCHHMLQIMEAEVASLGKKQTQNEIRKLYEEAINVASRSGFNHNAALTCELYGAHLERVGDMEESKLQLRRSVRKYTEWNAHAKVAQMTRRYAGIEVPRRSSELQSTSRNLHGRERHEEIHQDTHVGDWISKASVHGSILESTADLSGHNSGHTSSFGSISS